MNPLSLKYDLHPGSRRHGDACGCPRCAGWRNVRDAVASRLDDAALVRALSVRK